MTTPHAMDKKVVMEFIKSIPGMVLSEISHHENFVRVKCPVKSVNSHLGAEMTMYVHARTGKMVHRSIEKGYSLPNDVKSRVHFVSGISHFPHSHMVRVKSDSDVITTPQSIWKRYNITLPTSTSPKNKQAVATFFGDYFSQDDLTKFQNTYKLPSVTPVVNGKNDASNPSGETALDVQYVSLQFFTPFL